MQLSRTSRYLHGCAALVLGVAITACSAGADKRGASSDESTATTTIALTTSSEARASGAVDASRQPPSVTIVYECSTDGRWWATKPICQANCAGGFCIACGLDCQN
jgi:hypothetical protein